MKLQASNHKILIKVVLGVAFAMLIPLFVMGLFEISSLREELIEKYDIEMKNNSEFLSAGLTKAIWDYSLDYVGEIVSANHLGGDDVVHIIVKDMKGVVLFEKKKVNSVGKLLTKNITTPVIYKNQKIAQIDLLYTYGQVEKSISEYKAYYIKMRLLYLFLTLIFIVLILNYSFISKIKILSYQASLLKSKILYNSFGWKEGDELDNLGVGLESARVSLNSLFKEIEDRNFDLMKLNYDLEEKVKEKSQQVVHSAKMMAIGEMAAGVAHEINNPLTVILGASKSIARNLEHESVNREDALRQNLKIQRMATRISKIVYSLRIFSGNSKKDDFKDYKLSSIFEDTLDLCLSKMTEFQVRFDIEQIPDVAVPCRSIEISQVILNLINNAVDAIKNNDEKWVSVKFDLSNEYVVIKVIDSGKGIPPELIEKIMQPFFTTKELGKGTGLGLSISKGIVEDHGGSLEYDKNNSNTCFLVKLPIV